MIGLLAWAGVVVRPRLVVHDGLEVPPGSTVDLRGHPGLVLFTELPTTTVDFLLHTSKPEKTNFNGRLGILEISTVS